MNGRFRTEEFGNDHVEDVWISFVLDGTALADEPLWFPGRISHVLLVGSVLAGLMTANKRAQTVIADVVLMALAYISTTRLWNPR